MYSVADFCFEIIRLGGIGLVIAAFWPHMPAQLSVIIGIVASLVIYWLYFKVMRYCFGCEALTNSDNIWMYDNDTVNGNITGLFFTDRFEFEQMKEFLLNKTDGLHRMRHKLVKILGQYFFKRFSDEEWESKQHIFVEMANNVNSDDDLAEFMV